MISVVPARGGTAGIAPVPSAATTLLGSFLLLAVATPAAACTPPAPTIRLAGESDEAFFARSRAFADAEDQEMLRRVQQGLFDQASRVSLARVIRAGETGKVLSDALTPGRWVEAQPLASFKGDASAAPPVRLTETGMTSCGPVGGGPATRATVGDYILLFENAGPGSSQDHFGLFLRDLREPRILERFTSVVQAARKQASAQP